MASRGISIGGRDFGGNGDRRDGCTEEGGRLYTQVQAESVQASITRPRVLRRDDRGNGVRGFG
jgi:hypothetical protein